MLDNPLVLFDPDGRQVAANPAARALVRGPVRPGLFLGMAARGATLDVAAHPAIRDFAVGFVPIASTFQNHTVVATSWNYAAGEDAGAFEQGAALDTIGSSRHGGRREVSEEHITRRSLASRGKGRTDWSRLRAMDDAEIERGAAEDQDNPGWTDEELQAARLVLPSEGPKLPVSIRLDPEVLRYSKEQGPGYQSRINAVLLAYVRRRRGRRKR